MSDIIDTFHSPMHIQQMIKSFYWHFVYVILYLECCVFVKIPCKSSWKSKTWIKVVVSDTPLQGGLIILVSWQNTFDQISFYY